MTQQIHGMHIRHIFKNHLSYSKGTKANLLDYRGYYNDTCQKFDDVGSATDSVYKESLNEGYVKRMKIFQKVSGYTSV